MCTRCWAMTAKEATVQQQLLSNGFGNKHFGTVKIETTEERCFLRGLCRDATQKETAIDQQQHSCETLICQRHQTIVRFLSTAAMVSTRWRVRELYCRISCVICSHSTIYEYIRYISNKYKINKPNRYWRLRPNRWCGHKPYALQLLI
jgi:hypothetical protein